MAAATVTRYESPSAAAPLASDVRTAHHMGNTSLDGIVESNDAKHPETAELMPEHGGKTGEEFKAGGK